MSLRAITGLRLNCKIIASYLHADFKQTNIFFTIMTVTPVLIGGATLIGGTGGDANLYEEMYVVSIDQIKRDANKI